MKRKHIAFIWPFIIASVLMLFSAYINASDTPINSRTATGAINDADSVATHDASENVGATRTVSELKEHILSGLVQDDALYYYPDNTEADQGVTAVGGNCTTIYDVMQEVGTSGTTVIVLRKGTLDGETNYALDTSIDLSTYPNIFFLVQNGARLTRVTGDETITFYSPENIIAYDKQIISTASMIAFNLGGRASVCWFGAVGDGSTDDAPAINRAFSVSSNGYMNIYAPGSTYLVSSTLTIDSNRLNFVGDGIDITIIQFAPVANDVCLHVGNGASIIGGGRIKDMSFYSADTTYTKTAIQLSDIQTYEISNIRIYGAEDAPTTNLWGGGDSIGLQTMGRDNHSLNNLEIQANIPIKISDNPNSTIDIDHYDFHNLYLIGDDTNPLITVDDGVNLTSVTFGGKQAWVLGAHGFYWNDTTSSQASIGLYFYNVRLENGQTGYNAFYLNHNYELQQVSFTNVMCGVDRKGIYARNVFNLNLINFYYRHSSAEALNVDSTVNGITMLNCFWQAGSSATMSGQTLVWGSPKYPFTAPLPANAQYDLTTNLLKDITFGRALSSEEIEIDANGTYTIGDDNVRGLLTIVSDDHDVALFMLRGSNAATTEVSDPETAYSNTQGTESSTNIFFAGTPGATGSGYKIENRTGATVKYKITCNGTYTSF